MHTNSTKSFTPKLQIMAALSRVSVKKVQGLLILVLFGVAYLLMSRFLYPKLSVIEVTVTSDSYLIGSERKHIDEVVEMVKSYEDQGFEICLEHNASPERLTAITDKLNGIEFRRKSFLSKDICR